MSRDGTLDKGSKLVNVYTEATGGRIDVYSRPGISTAANTLVGFGNGIFNDGNDLYTAVGGTLGLVQRGLGVNSFVTTTPQTNWRLGHVLYLGGYFYLLPSDATEGSVPDYSVYRSAQLGASASWALMTSTLATPAFAQARVYNGVMYGVRAGVGVGQLEYSANGSTWTTTTVPALTTAAIRDIAVYKNELWAWGTSSFYHSATPQIVSSWASGNTTGLRSQYGFRVAVLDDDVYMIGGITTSPVSFFNSVYKSSNGSTWALHVSNAAFPPTYSAGVGSYKGSLFIGGGNVSTAGSGSVWTSVNGSTWVATTANVYQASTEALGFSFDEQNIAGINALTSSVTVSTGQINHWSEFVAIYSQSTISSIANPNNVPVDYITDEVD